MLPIQHLWSTLVALAATTVGIVGVAAGPVLAQVPPDASPWVAGGSATIAVGGLAFMAKKVASGELVAVAVDQLLEDAAEREDKAAEREAKLTELLQESHRREDSLRDLYFADRTTSG